MAQPSVVRNVLSNWVGIPLNLSYALFITPLVVRALDKELYGVWSFLNGLLMYTDLLYLGLGSALVKYVAQYRASNDHHSVKRVFSVVLGIYATLGLTCLSVALAASGFVPQVFAEPLSAEAAHVTSITCMLLGLQLFLLFVGSALSGLICGCERYDLVSGVAIVMICVRFVATPFVLRASEPMLGLAMLMVGVAALQAVVLAVVALTQVPDLPMWPAVPTLAELGLLYRFGLETFFLVVGIKIISYTDITVIAATLGASSVALYALPLQLIDFSRACINGFTGVQLPRLTGMSARNDSRALRDAYLSTTRIACFLGGWLFAGLISLGPAFLNRWVGTAFGTPVQWVLVFLGLAAFGQVLALHAPLAFYQSLHLVSFPAKVLLAEAGLNLGLSIWLAPRMGISGVALATALPALLVSALVIPAHLCRRLGVPIRRLVESSVLPGVAMLAATLVILQASAWLLPPEDYPSIVANGLMTLPVAALVFTLTFPLDERRAVWGMLRRVPEPVQG